jgi:hypothetical protein
MEGGVSSRGQLVGVRCTRAGCGRDAPETLPHARTSLRSRRFLTTSTPGVLGPPTNLWPEMNTASLVRFSAVPSGSYPPTGFMSTCIVLSCVCARVESRWGARQGR